MPLKVSCNYFTGYRSEAVTNQTTIVCFIPVYATYKMFVILVKHIPRVKCLYDTFKRIKHQLKIYIGKVNSVDRSRREVIFWYVIRGTKLSKKNWKSEFSKFCRSEEKSPEHCVLFSIFFLFLIKAENNNYLTVMFFFIFNKSGE